MMQKRRWINSGITEELDAKQVRLVELVYEKVVFYYKELHLTRACYKYPLSLSRLMKLCKRNSYAVSLALRFLAHTVPVAKSDGSQGGDQEPLIYYDRISADKNKTHRPYRIFLTKKYD